MIDRRTAPERAGVDNSMFSTARSAATAAPTSIRSVSSRSVSKKPIAIVSTPVGRLGRPIVPPHLLDLLHRQDHDIGPSRSSTPYSTLRGPTGDPPRPLPDQTTNLAQPVRCDPRHPALLDQPFQYPGEPLGRQPLASRRTKHQIFGIPGRVDDKLGVLAPTVLV